MVQSRFLLVATVIFVTTIGWVQALFADELYSISGVDVQGYKRIDPAAIKAQLSSQSGSVSSSQINSDVKTLYNSGFFDQVTVSMVPSASGRAVLRYDVVEKPIARKIFIKGNDAVSESDLADVVKIEGKRFVDKAKLQALVRKAQSYYQGQGFYDAALEYATAPVGENEVDVTFTVNEGKRYRVREVSIQGAKDLDADDMSSEMNIKTYKWWNSWLFGTGRVNQEMMDADKQVLRQYLMDHGRLDGQVGEASVEKRDDGLYVSFDITEGKEYKIGKVKASGDLVGASPDKTLKGVKSESGEVFNASQVREDIFSITDKFADEGYAFANVIPNTVMNREDGTVDLDFTSTQGQKVRINNISITGNEKTYDHVIRRWLTIGEQETYSGSKIKRSQTLLQRLGAFDEVSITNKATSDPAAVDLEVVVKEATTGSFSAGAGYSTQNGSLFNTRVSENNLFGTGRKLNLNLDFGSQVTNQILSIDDPRLNDSWFTGGLDLFRTTRQYNDFDREVAGGSGALGYPLERVFGETFLDINANLKYELQHVNINDVEDYASQFVKNSEGKSVASSITPSLIRNTINNPLNPTRGSKQVLSVEFAGLGGDQEFYLVEARNSWFYPLAETSFGEFVISDRTSFGYGESMNDDPFPLFRRFFPGGINSVRGFRNRTLGPEDLNGREYGGSKQFVNNIELIFPLINSAGFKGVIFYDVGQAFDDNEPIALDGLRQAWGYGIRWNSPMGPIRVEFGYPIARQDGERGVQTMFSFGAPL
ncbi:MAG: outer membrane protein assembly factor BamA [Pseudomonadota bacterium]|jgi:outer membrane protein insertion porin family